MSETLSLIGHPVVITRTSPRELEAFLLKHGGCVIDITDDTEPAQFKLEIYDDYRE